MRYLQDSELRLQVALHPRSGFEHYWLRDCSPLALLSDTSTERRVLRHFVMEDMGMDDVEPFDDESAFEPLEVDDCMVWQYKYKINLSCSPYLEMKKYSNYISDL